MKRCPPIVRAPLAAVSFLAAVPWLLGGGLAHAQSNNAAFAKREFPKAAMRGEIVVKNHQLVTINGKSEQLPPGARIFNQSNLLVLSNQLVNQEVLVNYLRDGIGQIQQVWILNLCYKSVTSLNNFPCDAHLNSDP